MFKSIKYLRYDQKKKQYIYQIVDTDFICEVEPPGRSHRGAVLAQTAAVIQKYSCRSLNVPKNLALYYLFFQSVWVCDALKFINEQRSYLDKYYPKLEFSEKYYHQTLDIIKKLTILL